MNFLEKFFPLCGLLLTVLNDALFRCGKISYRKPKMEAWMSLKPTFFGMSTSLHLAVYSPFPPFLIYMLCFPFVSYILLEFIYFSLVGASVQFRREI